MARAKRPWFRFYVEAAHDMKLRQLTPTQRWLWVSILSAARESPIPGYLMLSQRLAMSEPMLSDYAAVRLQDVRTGIKSMESIGLIEWDSNLGCWYAPRWSDRQYESDDVSARTAKHRSQEQPNTVPRNGKGTFHERY
jgi:hypothetical protein